MPPKKAEEKLSELLEVQLRPIKEAIKDLITNEAMAKHIDLLETKLVRKINEQAAEIDQLKTRHSHLEGRVAILENLVKLQEIKTDDVEQYGRRLCLRVNGIPVENGERVKDLENRLHQEFSNMGLNILKDAIDRVHRIGRKFEIEDADEDGQVTGVSVQQQVIIRFTNWRDHTQIYRERKRSKSLKFKVDLTKRRVNLLDKARRETQHVEGIKFVFADINYRLNVRFTDDSVKAFNSETELASIIASCDER